MPIPVIDHTQGVPEMLQWQEVAFQPAAFNTPTSWMTGALPPGLTLNSGTGRVAGTPTVPGIYNVIFLATNASGTSDEVIFTFGIQPGGTSAPSSHIEAEFDLTTRMVTFPGALGGLLRIPSDDDVIFHLTLRRSGVVVDLDADHVKFAAKLEEPETAITPASSWRKVGSGTSAAYQVYVRLASAAINAALADGEGLLDSTAPEADFEKRLAAANCIGEFEVLEDSPYYDESPAFGTATLRHTSWPFQFRIGRDLIA